MSEDGLFAPMIDDIARDVLSTLERDASPRARELIAVGLAAASQGDISPRDMWFVVIEFLCHFYRATESQTYLLDAVLDTLPEMIRKRVTAEDVLYKAPTDVAH